MEQMERMLYDIGMVDFTIVELGLYLDTHPKDHRAIDYYNHYANMKKKMEILFAKQFYPLCMAQATGEGDWSWGEAPLPWEGGCR